MKASSLIKKENSVESPKTCRWYLSAGDALGASAKADSGQNKLQKVSECTGAQDEITQDHRDQSAEQTVGTELSIKTKVTTSDAALDVHLNQKSCSVHQANRTYECSGNQPFEAEENQITIGFEYVDVNELSRLQTNAILDHEQDDLQTNPLELICQDREDHGKMSNNMCADGTELSIQTEATTPDAALDLHFNQKSCTAHEANWTYEYCGQNPDDLFEAEENPIAIKSENEEVDEEHQLQTTNDVLDHGQDNQNTSPLESICQDQKDHPVAVADNTSTEDSTAESIQNVWSPGTRNAQSKSHSENHKHRCAHCSETYPFLSMLKVHNRIHTGEKPHLLIQLQPPSGLQGTCPPSEKPYQCKICEKAFKSSGNLKQHSKIHNKIQQHQCPHCLSMFGQASNLKIHIRIHHTSVK